MCTINDICNAFHFDKANLRCELGSQTRIKETNDNSALNVHVAALDETAINNNPTVDSNTTNNAGRILILTTH